MADSVGTVQLDVEINQKSLNNEMNKLGSIFNNSFKNMFSGIVSQTNNFVKDSIGRMSNSFKSFTQAGTGSSDKVSKSIDRMNTQYEKTQEEIRKIQEELANLDAQRDAIIEGYKDMPAFSGMSEDESLEQMLKADTGFQKLTDEIDKLTAKIDPLISKNKNLADEIKNTGDNAQDTGKKLGFMGKKSKKAGKNIEKASLKTRLFGDEMKKGGAKSAGFAAMISRSFKTILRRIFVYSLILKGIRGLINYTGAALKTNKQFVHSLNVIKTNLMVAFQPIYDFILPALNALMQAIATVTTYIASAISALFGKTYKQSFGAAKNMDNTKKAMAGYGKAAKKAGKDAQGALMGFDEINQLDLNKDKDDDIGGGGAGDFEMTMPDLATIDMSGIDKFKEIMSQIFEPFKTAWENEGQATIDAIKYALESIKELVKAIGRSWLEVWTNGTGQKVLENILKIIQNIFNIAGNLATAFKNAWNENEVGTRIIQGMFDIFNIILETIGKITKLTAEWAKTLDFSPLLESISTLLEALKPLTQNIGDGLAWLWENALLPIAGWTIEDVLPAFLDMLSGAIRVLNSVIEVLKPLGSWLWDNFLLPLAKWTGGAIVDILDGIAYAFEAIADYIEGIQEVIANSDGFLNALVNVGIYLVKGLFKGILSALAGIGDWLKENLIDPIVNWVKKLFGISSPSTVFMEIGVWLIEGLLQGITNTWTRITDFLNEQLKALTTLFTETWQDIKENAEEIWNAIAEFFVKLWEGITTALTEAWTAIVEFLVELWEGLSESVTEIWTAISEFISSTWNAIKEKTSEVWNIIKTFLIEKIWNPIKSAAQAIWNGIKKFILDPIIQAKTSLEEKWRAIKKYILDKWNEIKQGIADMKDKLVNAIMKPFQIADGKIHDVIGSAKNWGKNLIQNFIDGIKSMIGKVKDAVSNVADTVADFLGFHSPAKKGPGAEADKWMPNLMGMLADGIQDNIYEVSAAVSMTAGSIERGIQPNTDDMASAVGSAVLQSMQMAGSNQSQGDTIVEFNIDGATFARLIIPYIDKEKGRTGETIIQPI